jgi:hypothetical protein
MSLPAFATVSQLEVRLGLGAGSIQGEDLARAEALLDDVSTEVRAHVGTDWVDGLNALTAPPLIGIIVLRAAMRGYRNPDGVGSESLGGLYTYSYASGEATAYLNAQEIEQVKAAAVTTGAASGATSVATPSAYSETALSAVAWWL